MRVLRTVGLASAMLMWSGVAAAQQMQLADVIGEVCYVTTPWCWYNHHPDTGLIATQCEVTVVGTENSVTITYWENDGSGGGQSHA